jgi:hypothetical protein
MASAVKRNVIDAQPGAVERLVIFDNPAILLIPELYHDAKPLAA